MWRCESVSRLGVAGVPLVPRDVPVAEALGARKPRADGVEHLDDVAALGVFEEPLRVTRTDVEAAVAGVRVTLRAYRPRSRVHKDTAVGHLGGEIHFGAIPVGRVGRYPVRRGIHN